MHHKVGGEPNQSSRAAGDPCGGGYAPSHTILGDNLNSLTTLARPPSKCGGLLNTLHMLCSSNVVPLHPFIHITELINDLLTLAC
jgi:hypothetical protein